jgi:hypothetical protein
MDAHHILERKLWSDGGYYTDNGASVCAGCHLKAETTEISCEELREKCGITRPILPEHLYRDERYDKWGNVILPNGQRIRGELMEDGSVQKILASYMHLFTGRVKYPRTYHLPWSPGYTDDDRVMKDPDACFGQAEVVVTEKMDGECTTMYPDGIHARSTEYSPHPSRDRVRALHASIAHDIPAGWRLCGENLYAVHSLEYDSLPSFFLLFSVWDQRNECLSWADTKLWATLLGLKTVPVLYQGTWDPKEIRRLGGDVATSVYGTKREGYVVRTTNGFHYKDFRNKIAKYVRKDHVVSHGHWMHQTVRPNGIKE